MLANLLQDNPQWSFALGTVHSAILRCGEGMRSKGALDLTPLHVSGWLLVADIPSDWLLNIQTIFSTPGYVPYILETTVLDYLFFFFFVFLGLCPWPVGVSRPGVDWKLQPSVP